MTYEQYWHEDVLMVGAFRKAEELRQERQNTEAWLQGMYFCNAMSVVMANAFRKKGAKPEEYPAQPYPITAKAREEAKRLEAERERERLVNYLNRVMAHDKFRDE